eukprot:7574615-Ditylum_brightwellii.AAC.1
MGVTLCHSGALKCGIEHRSQSGWTYLERDYKTLNDTSRDDLIVHTMKALTDHMRGDVELTKENSSVAVVGKDETFSLIEGGGDDYDDDNKEAGEEETKEKGGVEEMET